MGGKLSKTQCTLVLVFAFLGWMCAGWQLAISSLAMRDAAADLLRDDFAEAGIDKASDEGKSEEEQADAKKSRTSIIGSWYGRMITAFLLGAALGGYAFGWLGDRFGRTKAMALSIVWYSVFSYATTFATEPWHLVAIRFLTCMGVGGMWPNGIALVSEVWPNVSRPILAGAIGTAANFGIMMLSAISNDKVFRAITDEDWHWIMQLGAMPVVLGLLSFFVLPESPKWLAAKRGGPLDADKPAPVGFGEIFKPSIRNITLLGIALGTIPLFGGWGSSNWVMPWSAGAPDPNLKANLSFARSLTGTFSSLTGGFLAMMIGRRVAYFVISLGALASAQILFWCYTPEGDTWWFVFWFGVLGLFSGFFFGWLPLCLPELFPTRVRSTGAGVSFNWGRIATAIAVLGTGELTRRFSYAEIGRATSLIYAIGLVLVFFMPDTSKRKLDEQ